MRLSIWFVVAVAVFNRVAGVITTDDDVPLTDDDNMDDDDWAMRNDASIGSVVPSPAVEPLTLEEATLKGCNMEPPFLYFTFHDAGKVTKYTRDGCFLQDQVLRGPALGPGRPEFRQMALGPYKNLKNVLYLAQGHSRQPQIMVFGECVDTPAAASQGVSHSSYLHAEIAEQDQLQQEEGAYSGKDKGDNKEDGKKGRVLTDDAAGGQFLDNGPVKRGQRDMIGVVTGTRRVSDHVREAFGPWQDNEGAKHAFGLAIEFDPHPLDQQHGTGDKGEGEEEEVEVEVWEGPLYASFQHTDIVMRFSGANLDLAPLPPALTPAAAAISATGTAATTAAAVGTQPVIVKPTKPYLNGTFHQFGAPGKHKGHQAKVSQEEQGVRGVIVCGTNVWIANENIKGILVVNKISGLVEQIIQVVNPISMFHYRKLEARDFPAARGVGGDLMGDNLVYVSSKKSKGRGRVLAIADDDFQVVREFWCDGMSHPAGLTVYNKILYVVEQFQQAVHSFNTVTGEYLGTIIDNADMPYDRIEQVALSPC